MTMTLSSLPRVLLVSNSRDEREMYAESFRHAGYCTLQAQTAADAYRLASELPPAVVVTDVRLPGDEDGLALTRRLKRDKYTRSALVVVLTGHTSEADHQRALRAGCDLYVSKPYAPDALAGAVAGLRGQRADRVRAVSA